MRLHTPTQKLLDRSRAALILSLFTATTTWAAPSLVTTTDTGGNIIEITGATDILIGGSLFDVQFFDGTFTDLYPSGSAFVDEQASLLASQALLSLYNAAGSDVLDAPELTRGIEPQQIDAFGSIITPYGDVQGLALDFTILNLEKFTGFNGNASVSSSSPSFRLPIGFDTGNDDTSTFAVWSPAAAVAAVPEPSTYAMMGLGLLGVAGMSRRKNQA